MVQNTVMLDSKLVMPRRQKTNKNKNTSEDIKHCNPRPGDRLKDANGIFASFIYWENIYSLRETQSNTSVKDYETLCESTLWELSWENEITTRLEFIQKRNWPTLGSFVKMAKCFVTGGVTKFHELLTVKMNRMTDSEISNNPRQTHMAFRGINSKSTCTETEPRISLRSILKIFTCFAVDICMFLRKFQSQNSDICSRKSV